MINKLLREYVEHLIEKKNNLEEELEEHIETQKKWVEMILSFHKKILSSIMMYQEYFYQGHTGS